MQSLATAIMTFLTELLRWLRENVKDPMELYYEDVERHKKALDDRDTGVLGILWERMRKPSDPNNRK